MKVMESNYSGSTRDHAAGVVKSVAPARTDNIKAWALWGAVWLLIAVNAWVRWIMSDKFGPAPIMPGDVIDPTRLLALRVLEVISTLVVLQCVWRCAIKPWMKERKVTLEGMLLLGGVIGFSADSLLNLHQLLFAFNAHSINLGVWTSFMPFYTGGPSRYAESLLWGFPMYVYFGITASYAGCAVIKKLRQSFPDITNASALAITYAVFIAGDFVLENAIIRTTDAYMFTKTYGPLTVFEGSMYQFPMYEAFLAGGVSLGFTMLRQSALDDPNGLSMVERGAMRLNPRYRTFARTLAVVGACGALFICVYHLPFNWLGIVGTSVIQPPSYMLPG
jgi:Spirocyclase AveC-like